MKNTDAWMPLFIADYLADTPHLSAVEHGAYLLLLMCQWRMGALPDDDKQLARMARCSLKQWQSIAPTVRAFFDCTPVGLVQRRLESEKSRSQKVNDMRSLAGKIGGTNSAAKRLKNNNRGQANAKASLDQVVNQNPTPSPLPIEISPSNEGDISPHTPQTNRQMFEDWWRAYPRKVGKEAAWKKYEAALKRGVSHAELATGLQRAEFDMRDGGKFIPHAQTWLNQGRWQDEPTVIAERDRPFDKFTFAAEGLFEATINLDDEPPGRFVDVPYEEDFRR